MKSDSGKIWTIVFVCLVAIVATVSATIVSHENAELRAENARQLQVIKDQINESHQLLLELQWWRCERQIKQPPSPIAIDGPTLLEDIPQLELDEAVPPLGVVGAARSGKWPAVRAEYLRLHPTCEACGTDRELNVHHVHPFHEHPELELQMSNLITLCRTHHLALGHDPDGPDGPLPRNWSASNPHVRRDAAKMLSKTTVAP